MKRVLILLLALLLASAALAEALPVGKIEASIGADAMLDEAETPAEPPTEPTTETPTEPPTEPTAETPTEPPTEPTAETPTEPTAETPTEPPTDPTAETPTVEPEPTQDPVLVVTKSKKVKMNIGARAQIDLNGKKASGYKSASAKIASVSKTGLVTALKTGKAKITITLSNKKKLVLTVQVVDPSVPTGITMAKKGAVTIGTPLRLEPVLKPETAVSKITWKSSDPKVATVSAEGVVTGLKRGKVKITATTANKKSATTTLTVAPVPVSVQVIAHGECENYNHVGYNWRETYTVNGVSVGSEPVVMDLCAGDSIAFTAKLTEADKYPETGKSTSKIKLSQADLEKGAIIVVSVPVKENKGRYKGKVARWKVTFEITPATPASE